MFKKPKPAPADGIEIPPATELNPTLLELETKSAELGAEASALREEDRQLAEEDGIDADTARDARVAEILGRKAPRVVPPRSERRQQIAARLRDIEVAREILRRERDTERNRASAILRDRLMPEYRKRMRQLIDALIAAHAAKCSLRNLASRIEDAGYPTTWMDAHPARWLDVGSSGNVGRLVDEARAAGFISPQDIPEELTQ